MKVILRYLMKVILSVPDEGYSRNASCAQNLISSFLLYFIKMNNLGSNFIILHI
jgi:hypothetical protein